MNINDLFLPFPARSISWRVGATSGDKTKAIALAYVDARDVMKRLDSVCGAAGWQCRYPWSDGKRLVCEVGVKIGDDWLWKANGCGDTDVEAEKGAMSDAFKRAAVLWGIAQYLYELPNTWVPIEPAGKSYKFSDATKRELADKLDKWQTAYFNLPKNEVSPDKVPVQNENAQRMIECVEACDGIETVEQLGDWWAGALKWAKSTRDVAIVATVTQAKDNRKAQLAKQGNQ